MHCFNIRIRNQLHPGCWAPDRWYRCGDRHRATANNRTPLIQGEALILLIELLLSCMFISSTFQNSSKILWGIEDDACLDYLTSFSFPCICCRSCFISSNWDVNWVFSSLNEVIVPSLEISSFLRDSCKKAHTCRWGQIHGHDTRFSSATWPVDTEWIRGWNFQKCVLLTIRILFVMPQFCIKC